MKPPAGDTPPRQLPFISATLWNNAHGDPAMPIVKRRAFLAAFPIITLAVALAQPGAAPNSQPNPYRTIENFFKMPDGRAWGSTSAVDLGGDGHIWVAERCGANSCADSPLAPVLEFDSRGKLLKSFGAGMLLFPHNLVVDGDGNRSEERRVGKECRSRWSPYH